MKQAWICLALGVGTSWGLWALWTGRAWFWREHPKRLRFVTLPAPGWATFYFGLAVGAFANPDAYDGGRSNPDPGNTPAEVIARTLMSVGLVAAGMGTLGALWGCVGRLPKRADPPWFRSPDAPPPEYHPISNPGTEPTPEPKRRGGLDLGSWWRDTHIVRILLGVLLLTIASTCFVVGSDDERRRQAGAAWLIFVGGCALIVLVFGAFQSRGGEQFRRALGGAIFSAVGLTLAGVAIVSVADGDAGLGFYTFPMIISGLIAFGFFGWVAIRAATGRRYPGQDREGETPAGTPNSIGADGPGSRLVQE